MLTFKKEGENFVITETIHSFFGNSVKVATYTPDLMKSKVNDDPWRDTTEGSRNWFNKHYANKFEG